MHVNVGVCVCRSSSVEQSHRDVYVPYTSGEWRGQLFSDNVSLAAVPDHSFVVNIAGIEESSGFFLNHSLWQGILGLGYSQLARVNHSTARCRLQSTPN